MFAARDGVPPRRGIAMRPCVKKIIGSDFELWNAIVGPGRSPYRFDAAGEPPAGGDPRLPHPTGLGLHDRVSPPVPPHQWRLRVHRLGPSRDQHAGAFERGRLSGDPSRRTPPRGPGGGRSQPKTRRGTSDPHLGRPLRPPHVVGSSPERVGVARGYFNALLGRKPHLLGALATHLATATIFTGGARSGRPMAGRPATSSSRNGPTGSRSWSDIRRCRHAPS